MKNNKILCPSCENEFVEDGKFCPSCGNSLNDEKLGDSSIENLNNENRIDENIVFCTEEMKKSLINLLFGNGLFDIIKNKITQYYLEFMD